MSYLIHCTGENASCEVINQQSDQTGSLSRCIRQPQRMASLSSYHDKDWPSLCIVSVEPPGRLHSSDCIVISVSCQGQ